MYTYVAFYRNKQIVIQAATSYAAQTAAAAHFKARKAYEVTVMLTNRPDGSQVTHTPTF